MGRKSREKRERRDRACPTIAVAMIVKNEEAFLGDCLRSVAGTVDEIVVVDTGSTDRTVEIAQSFGAKIGFLPWQDDFSAPRNLALGMTTCDWFLVLDADERLAEGSGDELRRTVADVGPDVGAIGVELRSIYAGGKTRSNATARVYLRTPNLRWSERLHERLVPSECHPIQGHTNSRIVIEHLGYQPEIWEQRKKSERNRRIIEGAIAAGEATDYTYMQLSRILEREGAPVADVEAALRTSIDLFEKQPSTRDLVMCLAYIELGRWLAKVGRTRDALDVANRGLPHFKTHPDLWFLRGRTLFDLGDYAAARRAFEIVSTIPEGAWTAARILPRDGHEGIRRCDSVLGGRPKRGEATCGA